MLKLIDIINTGTYLYRGNYIIDAENNFSIEDFNSELKVNGETPLEGKLLNPDLAKQNTITYGILKNHNTSGNIDFLKIKFDALASHDITYVGIVQTARASGLKEFPIPYVMTNCHNSLCAVGGTINEDDHVFGLSAAKKYGGIYVPAHVAVIHSYMREMMSSCGSMILGSDSHTRYGALGTMAIGEGGPELVKQLLNKTYDVQAPQVIAVYLQGKVQKGVGPQDVALALIKAVFKSGFVKNKVLEFVGPGISELSVDFRNGIDVMTTETTCLSSIWCTDERVAEYYKTHNREEAYAKLQPGEIAYYDGLVKVNLSKVISMIALPFHPSNVYSITELNENPQEILKAVEAEGQKQLGNSQFHLLDKIINGKIMVEQGIVAGCAGGTFENICEVAAILEGKSVGEDYFGLNVYPGSQPIYSELVRNGAISKLIDTGAIIKTAFCGPCFGAGDVPSNNALSIRHTTRNFPNREGSKPSDRQIASVALMDARSIAATALNGGILTPATEIHIPEYSVAYNFNKVIYDNRVYKGFRKAQLETQLKLGPSITDWPKMPALKDNMVLKMVSVINDEVTTTDELIPSGETSSYRSNPLKLAEFTLSRKDPEYVGRAKAVQQLDLNSEELKEVVKGLDLENTGLGSVIFARKPGDGSAREQAASCQKVLGGCSNIAFEYATKRYRSNLINWGMLPFTMDSSQNINFENGDYIVISGIKAAVATGAEEITAKLISVNDNIDFKLQLKDLSKDDRDIILSGCLINYYGK
ncbi:MAG: hydratase [Clostridiaceae bacterium]|nr:hydratase [Clostridiaceae bacterium]